MNQHSSGGSTDSASSNLIHCHADSCSHCNASVSQLAPHPTLRSPEISSYCSDCIFGIARLTCGLRICHLRCVDCVARQGLGEIRPSPTAHTSRGGRRGSPSFGFGVRGRITQCYTGDILGVLAEALSTLFRGSSVEIQRTLCKEGGMWPHRRSPHQALTACRTVCIVCPRLLRVPLPHVHRFSTVWVTCTEVSSRGAHVACFVACMLVFKI